MQDSEASQHRQHARETALRVRKAQAGDAKQETTRKQASTSSQTEARLSSIFRAAPVGIGLLSNRILLEVNDRMCQMVGYCPEELVGQSARMLYLTDEDYEYVGREKYRQIQVHGTGTVESRWRRKDGAIIDVLLSSTPLDLSDLSKGMTFTALDITDHKRREEALKASEQRFRTLIEQAADGIFVHDAKGRLLDVNPQACKNLGYTREELLALSVVDIDKGTYVRSDLENFWHTLPQRESVLFESTHTRKDGSTFPVEIRLGFLDLPEGRGILALTRDITERQAAQQAARESEMHFRELAEMLPQMVFEMDITGKLTFANDAGLENFGYAHEELDNLETFGFFAREDRDRIKQNIGKRLAGEPVDNREYQALRKDGSTFPVLLYASPIIRNGTPVGLRGIGLDITKRKKVEEERQARLHSLESMERINQVIRQATNPEQMLSDVIEMVYSIFESDRAWLLFPCNPDTPSFRVPIECHRPEYPGAKALGLEVPTASGQAQDMRDALASENPVTYTIDTERPVSADTTRQFDVQAQMFTAVYPKVGDPWLFGMHQCSHARVWTPEEQTLFKEIGRRIADGLSNLLSLRELKESEMRFRELAELLPQMVFEMDTEGRFTYVNRPGFEVFGYRPEELAALPIIDLFAPEDRERLPRNIRRVLQGEPFRDHEYTARKQDGTTFPVLLYSAAIIRDGHPVGLRGIVVDITERQYAEQALQESKTKLETILESSPNAITVMDLEETILDCNQAMLDMYGLTAKEELLGHSAIDLLSEKERSRAKEDLKKLLEQGTIRDMEYALLRKNNEEFPAEISASLIRNHAGEPVALVAVTIDITERKLAQEALRKSEEKYRSLITNIPDVVWTSDQYGNTTFMSRNVEDLCGYRSEDIRDKLGEPWFENIHPDDVARVREAERRLFEEDTPLDVEYRMRKKNGDWIWLQDRSTGTYEKDGVVYADGVFIDVTERKKTEEALEQSEQKFRSLVETSSDWIWEIDAEGRYTYASPKVKELLGYEPEKIIGLMPFDLMPPQEKQPLIEFFRNLRESPRAFAGHVNATLHRNGAKIILETSGVPILDSDGNYLGYRGIDRDITERKRLEQALERRIVALTQPLDQTEGIEFEEMFDLNEIQKLQDLFAKATGVASLITRPDGTPITKPSNFCRLCERIVRKTAKGRQNCHRSDSMIGCHNTHGPTIHSCLSAGLRNAGAGITVGGKHLANWLIGQVRDGTQNEEEILKYARDIDAEADEFIEAFHEIPIMSKEQFESIAQALFVIADQLSTTAYQNVQQARFIADRNRAQEQLAHERNLLRTLIDNLPDSTYIKDRDSRFILCSHSLLQAAGVATPEQIVGKTDFDFYTREAAKISHQEEQELMASGEPMINVERCVRDETTGQVAWDLTTKVPLKDNEGIVVGLVGISKNITERKEMEEALRASLQTSSDIVASIPSGLFIFKYEPPETLTLIAGNPAATQLTGLDIPKNIGRNFDELLPQARHTGLTENFLAVMKTGQTFETEEYAYDDERLSGVFSLRAFRIPGNRLCIAFEDVTKQRRAAQALSDSQEELAAIFNSAPTTMLVVDHEGRIRKANRASLNASGCSLEEIVGLHGGEALRCLHSLENPEGCGSGPACQECAVRNTVLDTLATGQEHRQVKAALPIGPAEYGGERVFEVSTMPLSVVNEKLALVCIDEVTERERVIDALKESEERYRELYEGSRDASVAVTMNGQILDCNSAYLEMLGYTKEELCQMHFQDITPPKWREIEETILHEQILTRGYSDVYQKEYRRKNGTVFPIELRAYLSRDRDGQPIGMWAFIRDITDRKQAEEALRESERTLMTLMGNLPGMAYRCRNVPAWTMEFVSEGCMDLTGYRPSELIGDQTRSYGNLIHADERAQVWEQIQKSLKERKCFELEYRIKTRDGEDRWVWEKGAGVYTETGEISALEGFVTDIAKHKKAEEKLLAYQAKLKSLASELALAEERERRRIAANLHDHACQSLALSKMKLQTLIHDAQPANTEMLQSVCDTLNKTLENVRELTFDLSSPILYRFGLEAALEELLKDKLGAERDVTYRFSNDGKPKPLAHDVLVLLYQSVRELLINIIKHSHAHEVTLDIRREEDSITIVLTDDGVGFDVDEILSFSSQRRSVGLFNTLERLDYIGGKLAIDSRRNHGSRLTLIAPLETKTHVAKENDNGSEDSTR